MSEIFVGRQPIYNRDLEIHAYELMSRASRTDRNDEPSVDDDRASSQVILNAFLDIGIDTVVDGHIAFIRLAERFLNSEEELPFPPDAVILKIPNYLTINQQILAGIHTLKDKGYKLAIDNYLQIKHLQPLASLADIIDLNVEQLNAEQLKRHIRTLRNQHSILLADHVKTYDEYELCRDLGFDFIQGYFLSRPKIVAGQSLAPNQTSIMNLLSVLHNPDTDTDTIDTVISQDVSLSYKILRLINSAFFKRATDIESIHHAIVMLGRKQLCTWASMMALTELSDKPREQIRIAMIRARSCERLAETAGLDAPDSFFTIGMFSALDLLMDQRLEDLISPLPLNDSIIAALLNREGITGEALNCTLAQETGDWVNIRFADLAAETLSDIYLEAICWADNILKTI